MAQAVISQPPQSLCGQKTARWIARLASLFPAPPTCDPPCRYFTRSPWRPRPGRREPVRDLVDRLHDNSRLGQRRVDGPGGLETAPSRHRNVHHDDVGLELWCNAQASFAGMAMGAKLPTLRRLEQLAKRTPHHSVIVNHEYPSRFIFANPSPPRSAAAGSRVFAHR